MDPLRDRCHFELSHYDELADRHHFRNLRQSVGRLCSRRCIGEDRRDEGNCVIDVVQQRETYEEVPADMLVC